MATIANTFLTFSAIGNREDLVDEIYNISPTDTPFQANIGKVKARAVLHEWQPDALAAAAANAQLEGDDMTLEHRGKTPLDSEKILGWTVKTVPCPPI